MRAAREAPRGGAEGRAAGAGAVGAALCRHPVSVGGQRGRACRRKSSRWTWGSWRKTTSSRSFRLKVPSGPRGAGGGNGAAGAAPSVGRAACQQAGPGRGESAACGGRGRAVLCRATESPAGIWPCPLPQRPASPGPHCPVRAGSGRKGCAARRCCVIVRER